MTLPTISWLTADGRVRYPVRVSQEDYRGPREVFREVQLRFRERVLGGMPLQEALGLRDAELADGEGLVTGTPAEPQGSGVGHRQAPQPALAPHGPPEAVAEGMKES